MAPDQLSNFHKSSAFRIVALVALLLIGFWVAERLLGRQFLSSSGFGLWTGAWTDHTSQWAADPYTFTHLLHGAIFYYLLLPARRRISLGYRFVIASLMEAGWEILENTPYVIQRYRNDSGAVNYFGDSILNSTIDLFAAMAGFWAAYKFHWKWMLTFAVVMELLCAYFIRDNLALNILMLLFPSEAIKRWQMGI